MSQIAFTAPHHEAARAGHAVLAAGGTAIEAMVAAAATIAVVYPHMNGLGGDGFWLISEPGKAPIAIDAAGKSAQLADQTFYRGVDEIPTRGGMAALTMAGAVAGWKEALAISHQWQQGKSLQHLFANAIHNAEKGITVTASLEAASRKVFNDLKDLPEFTHFLDDGKPLQQGKTLKQPKIAHTLSLLASRGLADFYQGELAQQLASELAEAGSPLRLEDFLSYQATQVTPLEVTTSVGTLYNLPAPTQGIASLLILALYDRLNALGDGSDTDMAHLLIEATKQAFIARNTYLTDPSRLDIDLQSLLTNESLDAMAAPVSATEAMPWPHKAQHGDTIWMGCTDQKGRMVSYIQSLYWEFGSGIVSPSTGIVWNNRGSSFDLDPSHLQALKPNLKPFHTLNPAFATLNDGRRISYGTMGGEGQPQTQAALFSRYVYHKKPLTEAIAEGRWLLGRTWGDQSHNLKVEADFAQGAASMLDSRGHDWVTVPACNELMGHAGAVVLHPNGTAEAATDPRSDGAALS